MSSAGYSVDEPITLREVSANVGTFKETVNEVTVRLAKQDVRLSANADTSSKDLIVSPGKLVGELDKAVDELNKLIEQGSQLHSVRALLRTQRIWKV